MSEKILYRTQAPFSQGVWEELDSTLTRVARSLLVGRRLLDVDGPYGLGTAAVGDGDEEVIVGVGEEKKAKAWIGVQKAIPVALIHSPFSLSMRNVASYEEGRAPLDTAGLVKAVQACCLQEDYLIFHGTPQTGPGLLGQPDSARVKLGDWSDTKNVLNETAQAVSILDERGFGGPFGLALGPQRYNALFQNHPGSDLLLFDNLTRLVPGGIFKSSLLGDRGVLVAPKVLPASIYVAQDMVVAWRNAQLLEYQLLVMESIALMVDSPEAVCVLEGKQ